jgi:NAD(P)-dependent dehydrogenase (short-subunit alcohol dehydrogenase family)
VGVGTRSEPSQLLRRGLLEGVSVLVASARVASADQDDSLGGAVAVACAELGARVSVCSPIGDPPDRAADPALDEAAADHAVRAALRDADALDLLVVDAAGLFAGAAAPGSLAPGRARVALRTCLDASWNVTRAVVNFAFLPAQRGGRILYLAPSPGCGEHADGARAGLENLARTLSIEWARHSVTAVTIAPGDTTSASEVAALTAYLASPAGAYFSGCLMDLRGARAG